MELHHFLFFLIYPENTHSNFTETRDQISNELILYLYDQFISTHRMDIVYDVIQPVIPGEITGLWDGQRSWLGAAYPALASYLVITYWI